LDLIACLLVGLFVGGVYALVASGVVAVYKATKVFNFAVGEMVVLGGCVCLAFLDTGLPAWLSIVLAALTMGIVGLVIQKGFMSHFIGQSTLTATIGTCILIYFVSGVAATGWSGAARAFPRFLPAGHIAVGSTYISLDFMWSFILAVGIFSILFWFFQYTKMGFGMRSIAEDVSLSQSKGVRASLIYGSVWMIAGITAALGGIFLGYTTGIAPSLSLIGLKAFPVVFLGGLESFPGVLIGGVVLGMAEGLVGGYVGAEWVDITPFVILLVVLLLRPEGIFGIKRVERV
jgi:branched-chain amino acid transport system permease protein